MVRETSGPSRLEAGGSASNTLIARPVPATAGHVWGQFFAPTSPTGEGMELDLDPETVDSLAEEADERGFESPAAYVEWLLEHRESILRPPGERLQARIEDVEDELARLRRSFEEGVATEITVESGTGGTVESDAEGAWFDEGRSSGTDQDKTSEFSEANPEESDEPDEGGVSEFAYSTDLEPPAEDTSGEDTRATETEAEPVEDDPADAADDDEIAEALAEVDLDDEDRPDAEDSDPEGT